MRKAIEISHGVLNVTATAQHGFTGDAADSRQYQLVLYK
jgi:hypothetical protein